MSKTLFYTSRLEKFLVFFHLFNLINTQLSAHIISICKKLADHLQLLFVFCFLVFLLLELHPSPSFDEADCLSECAGLLATSISSSEVILGNSNVESSESELISTAYVKHNIISNHWPPKQYSIIILNTSFQKKK